MTKNKLFAWAITLLCFSLTSCSDEKDGPSKKILVTNAGVTEANQTVKPGDIVHIYGDGFQEGDRKSTRLNSSHSRASRMPSSA